MEPALIVLGLVVGTLVGMTGVGAGSLVTPALAMSGVPPVVAVGTDLAYAAVSKSFGALAHCAQRTLDLGLSGLLAAGSVPAAALTIGVLAATGAHAKSAVITAFLAFALILTALALLAGRARVAALAAPYEAR
ncbi:MAG: TSUP family transporter, partial [Burkholderiales bacterium]